MSLQRVDRSSDVSAIGHCSSRIHFFSKDRVVIAIGTPYFEHMKSYERIKAIIEFLGEYRWGMNRKKALLAWGHSENADE